VATRTVEQTGYHVVVRPDPEGGYVAVVPAFPGCYSQGETAEEGLSNVREAILLTIEDMRERGEAIPAPTGELSAEGDPLAWEAEGWS
jgi:antitoxin HicB